MSHIKQLLKWSVLVVLPLSSCAPDVMCPKGPQEAKELFAGAESGRGTEKKRTKNGLIEKKNPKPHKKRK